MAQPSSLFLRELLGKHVPSYVPSVEEGVLTEAKGVCKDHGCESKERKFGFDLCEDCVEDAALLDRLENFWQQKRERRAEIARLRQKMKETKQKFNNQIKHLQEQIGTYEDNLLSQERQRKSTNRRASLHGRK